MATAEVPEAVERALGEGAFSVEKFVESFPALVEATSGIHNFKEMVLTMAFSGQLLPRRADASSVEQTLAQIEEAWRKRQRRETLPPVSYEETPTSPDHWAWLRLGNFADVVGGVTKGRDLKGRKRVSLPYLRVANVQRGFLDLSEMKEIEIAEDELPKYQLQSGDVLFTEGGDWDKLGRSAVWGAQIKSCIHQNHVFRARLVSPHLDPAWFSAFANSPLGRNYFQNAAKRTTNLASINMTQLRNCPMPLPPLAEQKRIVARVDQLMALIDQLEAKQNRKRDLGARFTKASLEALTTAESPQSLTTAWTRLQSNWPAVLDHADKVSDVRRMILRSALRGRLVQGTAVEASKAADRNPATPPWEIPAHWSCQAAEDVCEFITKGTTPSPTAMTAGHGEVPFLKVYNLTFGGPIDFTIKPTFVSFATHETVLARSRVLPGDVLMNIVGPPLGKVSIASDRFPEWNINQAIARFRTRAGLTPQFLAMCLLEVEHLMSSVEADYRGTAGQDNISLAQCRSLPIPLPPESEQKRIVPKVEHLMKLCDALEAALRRREDRAAKLAEAVVQEMVA